jgi:hypothetical protein
MKIRDVDFYNLHKSAYLNSGITLFTNHFMQEDVFTPEPSFKIKVDEYLPSVFSDANPFDANYGSNT